MIFFRAWAQTLKASPQTPCKTSVQIHPLDGHSVNLWRILLCPAQGVAKTRSTIQVDVKIPDIFARNQRWIEPGERRQFVPQIVILPSQARVGADVFRGRRVRSCI